jgi:hypothetical protein
MSLTLSAATSARITSSCYATHNEEPIAAVQFRHGLIGRMRIDRVAIDRGLRPIHCSRAMCQDQPRSPDLFDPGVRICHARAAWREAARSYEVNEFCTYLILDFATDFRNVRYLNEFPPRVGLCFLFGNGCLLAVMGKAVGPGMMGTLPECSRRRADRRLQPAVRAGRKSASSVRSTHSKGQLWLDTDRRGGRLRLDPRRSCQSWRMARLFQSLEFGFVC